MSSLNDTRKPPSMGAALNGGKFLTFFLGKEEYGAEILKVQEIICMLEITPVPHVPQYIRGVMNLRGTVIPVVDLRAKLGLPGVEPTMETCIVVIRSGNLCVGVIVDRVSEVVTVAPGDIQPVPSLGADINTECLMGIGRHQGRIRLILDIEKVLSTPHVIDLQRGTRDLVA